MSQSVPVVEAKFTLLPELPHGRRGLSSGKYRPHIVIGPESQRLPIREGNRFTENYLGVMFGRAGCHGTGEAANVKLALMYFPECHYDEVQPGVTFTVREGSFIVATVLFNRAGWNLSPCHLCSRSKRKMAYPPAERRGSVSL